MNITTEIRFTVALLLFILIPICSQALETSDELSVQCSAGCKELHIRQDTTILTTPDTEKDSLKKVSFWSGLLNFISTVRGIDTNYVSVPKYPFLVSAIYSGMNVNTTLLTPELDELDFPPIKMHLNIPIRNRAGVSFNYRGLGIKFFTNLTSTDGSKLFSVELMKRKFGIEAKWMTFNTIPANISFTMDGQDYSINTDEVANYGLEPGGFDLKTFSVNGYYVISGDKFSYPSVIKYNTVQRRTAGSFIANATYDYSELNASNCYLFDNYFNNKTFKYTNNKIALGFGYAINIVPARGKVVIHLCAIPMAAFYFNSSLILENNPISEDWPQEYKEKLKILATKMNELAKKANSNTRVDFTMFTRSAITYNISNRFVLGINSSFSYADFGKKSSFRQHSYEVSVNASFGYRFGF